MRHKSEAVHAPQEASSQVEAQFVQTMRPVGTRLGDLVSRISLHLCKFAEQALSHILLARVF